MTSPTQIVQNLTAPEVKGGAAERLLNLPRSSLQIQSKGISFFHILQVIGVLGPYGPLWLVQVRQVNSLVFCCTSSSVEIPIFPVEIVNEKSFKFTDTLNTAVQERQVILVNQDLLEDFENQFWILKHSFIPSDSDLEF